MNVKTILVLGALGIALIGCNKYGAGGTIGRIVGDWVELKLPPGCAAKQIAASKDEVAVLCEDGRIFH